MNTVNWKWLGLGTIVLVLFVVAYMSVGALKQVIAYPKRAGLHAVFLTNGQVYFGKIGRETAQSLELSGIYYVKPGETSAPNEAANATLVKLGNEFHEPEDSMEINRSQILFIEQLKPDGKVSKAIEAYKPKN